MSKTKGGGSTRNGRDSNAQRLGVKVFDGTQGHRRHDHHPPARHQDPPRPQRRHRWRRHAVRARRRLGEVRRAQGPQGRRRHRRRLPPPTEPVGNAGSRRPIPLSSVRCRCPSSSTSASSTCAAATAAPAACRSAVRARSRMGGPNGGDGGKGGDVWLVADHNVASLLAFRDHPHRRAGNGVHGKGKDQHGRERRGRDRRPCPRARSSPTSTPARCSPSCANHGDRWLAAAGGRGGRGNAKFLSNKRRAPTFAEQGEHGEERWLKLELRLMADVALVGFPNVGKSTLISVISAAKPKIADYPFTTLEPNLGVVRLDDDHRVRRRRHPGPDRGGERGQGPRPPVPPPRRAGPGAVPPGRPRRARRRGAGRAGAGAARRARPATGPSCSTGRGSWSAPRPTWSTADAALRGFRAPTAVPAAS